MKTRRLTVIAADINRRTKQLGGIWATVGPWRSSTDRHVPGTRFRVPGKGRKGVRILVFDREGNRLLDHRSSETYRTNSEVERWLACWERGLVWALAGWTDRAGNPLTRRQVARRSRGMQRW